MIIKNPYRLSDQLPWLTFYKNWPVIINKDGSFQITFIYKANDHLSSTDDEIYAEAANFNNVLKRLGTGWTYFIEVRRIRSNDFPESKYPNLAGQIIEEERRKIFQDGRFFKNILYVTFVYMPPSEKVSNISDNFITENNSKQLNYEKHIKYFRDNVDKITDILSQYIPSVRALNINETLTYLHSCISTKYHKVNLSKGLIFLDLTDQSLFGGLQPKLGNSYLKVISIKGFPQETFPEILSDINKLGFEYRWVERFICLGLPEAIKELKRRATAWSSKSRSLWTIIKSVIFPEAILEEKIDSYSANRAEDCDEVAEAVNEDIVSIGYYTATILLWDENLGKVKRKARQIVAILNSRGFVSVDESFNSVEAFLGSMPGNCVSNVRRALMTSLNLSHLIPISSAWAGQKRNKHLNALSLLLAKTDEKEVYNFANHISDVGHVLIVGPTGTGKSLLLVFMSSRFQKYKGAQIFFFDKDYGAFCSTILMGGTHFDLGADRKISFMPLRNINDLSERSWALIWLIDMLSQEELDVTPDVKNELWSALNSLSSLPINQRTISGLVSLVQNEKIRAVLQNYTINGAFGHLFDSDIERLELSNWTTFEMSHLMEQNPKAVGPVMSYLFHKLDSTFKGQPAVIIIDEAWLFLSNPIFADKIKNWLKTLRKKNVCVWVALPSISDITQSPISDTLINSCPTKLFLPNSNLHDKSNQEQYQNCGLNEKQIQIIAEAIPKREYYIQSDLGNRKIELGIEPGSATLAICGSTSKADIAKMKELQKKYSDNESLVKAFLRYKRVKSS